MSQKKKTILSVIMACMMAFPAIGANGATTTTTSSTATTTTNTNTTTTTGQAVSVSTTTDNLNNAFISGKSLTLTNGTYNISSSITSLSSNITITGDTNTIINGNSKYGMSFNGVDTVTFKNIKFENLSQMTFKNSKSVTFDNCEFSGFVINGINLENFNSIVFGGCKISNIGSTSLDCTWQGMGIHATTGAGLEVYGSDFSDIYGQGAIFLTNTQGINIHNNYIHDTFYRGIELYLSGNSGSISGNNIYDIGKFNTTNSGVGCNGIFSCGTNNVTVENNTITNVYENAIEGNYSKIIGNTIDGTGIDMIKHKTPSGEGIFPWGSADIENNTIRNTYGPGINDYEQYKKISNVTITGNHIYKSTNSDYGIFLNSEIGYSVIKIQNNDIHGDKYICYLSNKPQNDVTITKDNTLSSN